MSTRMSTSSYYVERCYVHISSKITYRAQSNLTADLRSPKHYPRDENNCNASPCNQVIIANWGLHTDYPTVKIAKRWYYPDTQPPGAQHMWGNYLEDHAACDMHDQADLHMRAPGSIVLYTTVSSTKITSQALAANKIGYTEHPSRSHPPGQNLRVI